MKRSVYIETTIPSFYCEVRQEPEMVARRESTRRWWTDDAPAYDLFVSAFVLGELDRGAYASKEKAVALVEGIAVLAVTPEVEEIARVYLARHIMPRGEMGDAFHLAIASFYGMDFLLTWNCRHLANANKTRHLRLVNAELGLSLPVITTPDLLLREESNDAER
jgi:predicted nucleic acid-binding protein